MASYLLYSYWCLVFAHQIGIKCLSKSLSDTIKYTTTSSNSSTLGFMNGWPAPTCFCSWNASQVFHRWFKSEMSYKTLWSHKRYFDIFCWFVQTATQRFTCRLRRSHHKQVACTWLPPWMHLAGIEGFYHLIHLSIYHKGSALFRPYSAQTSQSLLPVLLAIYAMFHVKMIVG